MSGGRAYYNEHDPNAAAWLRELIAHGHIAPGDVDERSIMEVTPNDLGGYTQHHFFAGIGGWSLAARLAGWPDDKPIWTGSPPCQPFSCAGKQLGTKDERHLAPKFIELVAAIRPAWVFGEQVATAVNKDDWLDDLLDALEREGYATGAAVLPACGVGAPHIRQRLWFTARLGDADHARSQRRRGMSECADKLIAGAGGVVSRMAQSDSDGREARSIATETARYGHTADAASGADRHGPTHATATGWDGPDWIFCRDGKWRPVEPGTFPLAHGVSARVGRLRGYGNAIVPQVAAEVIMTAMELR